MSALVVAAAAAGLLGGVHCAGMCGGIAASLSLSARGSPASRQLAFNAGRIASYSAAGAVVGATGSFIGMAGPALAAQTALFIVANVLMVLLGLYIAGWGRAVLRLESAGRVLWRRVEPVARRLFPVDTTRKALAAGALWGFVPCGLVYSMLALALASGDALSGATVMAAFGAATLPTLLTAGLAAQKVSTLRENAWVRYPAAIGIIAMGMLGLSRVPGLQDAVLAGLHCVG